MYRSPKTLAKSPSSHKQIAGRSTSDSLARLGKQERRCSTCLSLVRPPSKRGRFLWCSKSSEFYHEGSQIVAAFFSTMLTLGVVSTLGLFYPIFFDVFKAGKVLTSWACSLAYATMFLTGPLTTIVIAKLRFRLAAMTGGCLSSLGLLVTAFAPNIYVVLVFMGLVSGFGYGMLWNEAINDVSLNFVKYRNIATALAVTGVGVGSFLYPILVNYLMEIYGWRGTILITSGITLNLCVAGALMHEGHQPGDDDEDEDEDDDSLRATTNANRNAINRETTDTTMLSNSTVASSIGTGPSDPHLLHATSSRSCGLAKSSGILVPIDTEDSLASCKDDDSNAGSDAPVLMRIGTSDSGLQEKSDGVATSGVKLEELNPQSLEPALKSGVAETSSFSTGNDESKGLLGKGESGSPKQRDVKVQFTGDVDQSVETTDTCTQVERISYHPHVTMACCRFQGFTLFHYSMLHVCNCLVFVALSVVFTHIAAYAETLGYGPAHSRILLSAQGMSSLFGRILLGLIAQHPKVNIHFFYLSCYLIAGISVAAMTFWTSFNGLVVCMVLFGIFYSAIAAVSPEVTIGIVGRDQFPYAYGFLMLSYGVGYLLGAPAAGLLYEITNKYYYSFYLGAAAFVLSGLVLIPPSIMVTIRDRKKAAAASAAALAKTKQNASKDPERDVSPVKQNQDGMFY